MKYSYVSDKMGFTLAEVLITLGVIGVVAAMTIPTLISNHNKAVVETKLKKIYSIMNQAINLSKTDNGEFSQWEFLSKNNSFETQKAWWDTYLAKYIVHTVPH